MSPSSALPVHRSGLLYNERERERDHESERGEESCVRVWCRDTYQRRVPDALLDATTIGHRSHGFNRHHGLDHQRDTNHQYNQQHTQSSHSYEQQTNEPDAKRNTQQQQQVRESERVDWRG